MTQDVTTKYDGMWIDRLNQVYVTVCIFVCTMSRMAIEWDPEKAAANLRQHGVYFADAVGVFEDPYALTREDPDAQGEQRFVSVGLDFFRPGPDHGIYPSGRQDSADFCATSDQARARSV